MAIRTKPQFYICTEAFVVTLDDGDHWFKAGQRVHAENRVFKPCEADPRGESARNRLERFFLAEESE